MDKTAIINMVINAGNADEASEKLKGVIEQTEKIKKSAESV